MKDTFGYVTRAAVNKLDAGAGVAALYRRLRDCRFRRRYGEITRFSLRFGDVAVVFSTEDYRSKFWFFPRYDGGKLHEEPAAKLMIQQFRSARCFADVGAHLGYYTCLACKFVPGGTIYAFEMDRFNYSLLEENLKLNGCENVYALNVAVSDTSGVASYACKSERLSPMLRLSTGTSPTDSDKVIPVQVISLDEYFHNREIPDLVKIDVEGAEMKVLEGMSRILEKVSPKLFIEVHPSELSDFRSSAREVVQTLLDRDYRVYEIADLRMHTGEVKLRELDADFRMVFNSMLYAQKG